MKRCCFLLAFWALQPVRWLVAILFFPLYVAHIVLTTAEAKLYHQLWPRK